MHLYIHFVLDFCIDHYLAKITEIGIEFYDSGGGWSCSVSIKCIS